MLVSADPAARTRTARRPAARTGRHVRHLLPRHPLVAAPAAPAPSAGPPDHGVGGAGRDRVRRLLDHSHLPAGAAVPRGPDRHRALRPCRSGKCSSLAARRTAGGPGRPSPCTGRPDRAGCRGVAGPAARRHPVLVAGGRGRRARCRGVGRSGRQPDRAVHAGSAHPQPSQHPLLHLPFPRDRAGITGRFTGVGGRRMARRGGHRARRGRGRTGRRCPARRRRRPPPPDAGAGGPGQPVSGWRAGRRTGPYPSRTAWLRRRRTACGPSGSRPS